jgi:hypothetical protein
VLKEIRGFTLPSLPAEKNGNRFDGVYGRDRVYVHYESIPEGEEIELVMFDPNQMQKLTADGYVRSLGRFVVPDDREEVIRRYRP